ncbi:hypothetical protein CRUP_018214, partial [Coryphaenoides rupestris]
SLSFFCGGEITGFASTEEVDVASSFTSGQIAVTVDAARGCVLVRLRNGHLRHVAGMPRLRRGNGDRLGTFDGTRGPLSFSAAFWTLYTWTLTIKLILDLTS